MGLVDTEVDPKRSGQWSTQGYWVHLRQGTYSSCGGTPYCKRRRL